jgi:hypothetical protein
MDGKADIYALVLQHPGDITDGILSLGNRHSVTHHNDHTLRGGQRVSRFIDCGFGDLALDLVFAVIGGCYTTEENICKSAVHGDTHNVGEDRTRDANEGSDGGEEWVVKHEAFSNKGKSRVGIQDCDNDSCG